MNPAEVCDHRSYRHLNQILTECLCFCTDCYDLDTGCICTTCNHTTIRLHNLYYSEIEEVVEHFCVICGAEVVRKGSRGRWPQRCPSCKDAA